MSVSNVTSSSLSNSLGTSASNPSAGSSSSGPSFQTLLNELTSYTKETPAQRMETAILAQLGITPAQLQAMPPAQREKVEQEVRELMKKELQAQQQQQQQQQQGTSQGSQAQAVTQTQTQTQAQIQHPANSSNAQLTTQALTHALPKKGTTIDFSL